MSLQNIKTSSRGFTIVELLIVVVVIAILAAITIISYNGITSRANASSAASNVETVQKIAETYNSDGSQYPSSINDFKNGYTDSVITTPAAKLPTSITISSPTLSTNTSSGTQPRQVSNLGSNGGLTASNGTNTVLVFKTTANNTSSGTPNGGVIVSWDYSTAAMQAPSKYTYYGSANSSSTYFVLP
jgi:prepilin-type N-terminal cleavage/methylation domain-containing protein